jgi:hypothetical protein
VPLPIRLVAPVPETVTTPHRLRSLDGQLDRARAVLGDPRARACARVGSTELPLGLVVVSSGRLVVTIGDGWHWPNDEPDMAGEVYVDGTGTGQPEVRLVGWWSPLTQLRRAPATPGEDDTRSTVLWLDAVEALITDGQSRVHLTEKAHVDWLLR